MSPQEAALARLIEDSGITGPPTFADPAVVRVVFLDAWDAAEAARDARLTHLVHAGRHSDDSGIKD